MIVGIGVRTFRNICAAGKGPKVWNPLDGRPRYVDTLLDEWLAETSQTQATA